MRRESVATLQVRHLDGTWGLRRVRVKGGQTRDIPLPESVLAYQQVVSFYEEPPRRMLTS
jgi:hypothetical protein